MKNAVGHSSGWTLPGFATSIMGELSHGVTTGSLSGMCLHVLWVLCTTQRRGVLWLDFRHFKGEERSVLDAVVECFSGSSLFTMVSYHPSRPCMSSPGCTARTHPSLLSNRLNCLATLWLINTCTKMSARIGQMPSQLSVLRNEVGGAGCLVGEDKNVPMHKT